MKFLWRLQQLVQELQIVSGAQFRRLRTAALPKAAPSNATGHHEDEGRIPGSDGQAKRRVVAEANRGKDQNDAGARRKPWVNAAITLLLMVILIVAGSAAMYSRQQWWEMYMRLTH